MFVLLALAPRGAYATLAQPAPSAPPKRIISLAPHITELLFMAGAGHLLVGTVNSSNYPASVQSLPKVGNGLHIDPETLVSLEPDLILGWQPSATHGIEPLLKILNIPLIHIAPKRVRAIPSALRRVGQWAGTETQANSAATDLEQRLQALSITQNGEPLSVVLEINASPLYVVGNDPLLNDALSYCNAKNHYGHVVQAAPQISLENLLARQPGAIVTHLTSAEALKKYTQALAKTGVRAARQQHVFGINADLLFRPGPRLIDALEQLCPLLKQAHKPLNAPAH